MRPAFASIVTGGRRLPLALAFLTAAFHLGIASRYGWFRDEMYFLACGRRLAWGYVDQPPLIALISRLAYALSGGHLALYRLPAALAHGALVFLAVRFAQRLGGSAILAGLCVALAPILAVEGHLLTMNAFEGPLYLAVVVLVVRVLQTGDPRPFIAVGALTGIGLLNKHSFLFYALCLVLALLLTPARRLLASRWFAAGAGLAAAIVLPHAIWQVRAGFPMLELLSAQEWKNVPWTITDFVAQQALFLNPLALAPAAAGFLFLWRRLRPVALAFVLQLLLFAALKGKAYYVAPAWLPLLAAGGAGLGQRWRAAASFALAASAAAILPLALPILPPAGLERYQETLGFTPPRLERVKQGTLPQHLADMFGWKELHDAVERAASAVPRGERAAVYTQNYGEAAALELFGSAGMPVVSGHNNYYLWGPPEEVSTLLIVGGRVDDHRRVFRECSEAARAADARWAMPYERGLVIWVCRDPRERLADVWPRVKHYQ